MMLPSTIKPDNVSTNRLRHVFLNSFTAADLAENLISFDETAAAQEVAEVAKTGKLRIVGVRREGVVIGHAVTDELAKGELKGFAHPLVAGNVVSSSASFPEVVSALESRSWIFVEIFDRVGGIITRTDVQKPIMRMWLFGMITILEMNITWAVETLYPNDTWTEQISAGRLKKAKELMIERKRRKQDCRLVDCLQFSDRGYILLNDEENRRILGYESRSDAKRTIKAAESLRNNLAHSQNIIAYDWEAIVSLVKNINSLLARQGVTRLVAEKRSSHE